MEILKISQVASKDMILNAIMYSRLEMLQWFIACRNYNFSTFDLELALVNCSEEIIDLVLESKQVVVNTAILLVKLTNSKITRKLLEYSNLTRLGYSCLIANARENNASDTVLVLEEFQRKNYPSYLAFSVIT
jgi:uncharacterized ubiquitin-like protein YukD